MAFFLGRGSSLSLREKHSHTWITENSLKGKEDTVFSRTEAAKELREIMVFGQFKRNLPLTVTRS